MHPVKKFNRIRNLLLVLFACCIGVIFATDNFVTMGGASILGVFSIFTAALAGAKADRIYGEEKLRNQIGLDQVKRQTARLARVSERAIEIEVE